MEHSEKKVAGDENKETAFERERERERERDVMSSVCAVVLKKRMDGWTDG